MQRLRCGAPLDRISVEQVVQQGVCVFARNGEKTQRYLS